MLDSAWLREKDTWECSLQMQVGYMAYGIEMFDSARKKMLEFVPNETITQETNIIILEFCS